MPKFPITPPLGGGRWNSWAAYHGGQKLSLKDRGTCQFDKPRGHGGRSGFYYEGDFGVTCCERHGNLMNPQQWKPYYGA